MPDGRRTRAPVLELPYELTSKIFVHCLPVHRRVRPQRQRAPLLLAQICSHWRAVALTTPELWSSIYLEFVGNNYEGLSTMFDPDVEPDVDHTCDLVELWLARAAGYPLSITLICRRRNFWLPDVRLPPDILSVIAAHSAHWRRIELQISTQDLDDFNEIPGPFPVLRSFAVQLTNSGMLSLPRVIAIGSSPNLSAFRLSTDFSPPFFYFPLENVPASLTALQLSPSNGASKLDSFVQLCTHFPGLLHLETYGMPLSYIPGQMGTPPILSGPPTLFPHLRSLLLHGSTTFLDFIHTPSLEHLGIKVSIDVNPPAIAAFFTRSASNLTHLTIHILGVPFTRLTACLTAVPALTTLEILCEYKYADLARYGFLESALGILPLLRTLIITDTLHTGPYAAFLQVLQSQRGLTRAELHIRPLNVDQFVASPEYGILDQFGALTAHGLTIHVTTPTYTWPRDLHGGDAIGNLGGFSMLIELSSLNVVVADYDVFGSNKMKPYFFSPFP
jgi:hypothetical protein